MRTSKIHARTGTIQQPEAPAMLQAEPLATPHPLLHYRTPPTLLCCVQLDSSIWLCSPG